MPANDGRHDCKPHHARSTAISAAAVAVLTVALAACTTTTATSGSTAQPGVPGAAGVAASRPAVTVTGAGSTFDAPFFDLAFAKYRQQ